METAHNLLSQPAAQPPGIALEEAAVPVVDDQSPTLEGARIEAPESGDQPWSATGTALVRSNTVRVGTKQELPAAPLPDHVQQLPFRLELRIPLAGFTLRQLRDLKPNAVLVSEHSSARDLVLTAAGERLLLVELEAVELLLAARVKRLL